MKSNFENFGQRSCAFLMDMLLRTIVFIVISLLNKMLGLLSPFMFVCACYAATILYFAYMEGGEYQATLGKRMLGLMVIRVDSDEPVTFKRALVRNILRMVNVPIYCAGYLPILFTKHHQDIQDLFVRTTVVPVEYEDEEEEEEAE